MPSFRRTLERVVAHAFAQLRESVKATEGEYAMDKFDITVDEYRRPDHVRMNVEFMSKVIWKKDIPIKGLTGDGVSMGDDELREAVTTTMKAHLDLIAQMHFARLDQLFPKAIHEVTMGVDPVTSGKLIMVKFKNGHVAQGPESEAKQEVFLARCAMLYDLPPI